MTHKHSTGSPCECEKLKNAEREELREGLKKCVEAREAERREREAENAKRADEAEAEVKSLKKKLIAFQLATAIGGAVIGQEMVNKITAKIDSAKAMQEKITGEAAPSDQSAAPAGNTTKIGWGGGWKPYIPKNKFITNQDSGSNGDISGVWAGSRISVTGEQPSPIVEDWSPYTTDTNISKPGLQQITSAEVQEVSKNLIAALSEPLPPLYTISFGAPLLPFDDSSGFAYSYAGAVVPSPAPITLFAMSGLIHNRRRA
jgi:hypothetical protein